MAPHQFGEGSLAIVAGEFPHQTHAGDAGHLINHPPTNARTGHIICDQPNRGSKTRGRLAKFWAFGGPVKRQTVLRPNRSQCC